MMDIMFLKQDSFKMRMKDIIIGQRGIQDGSFTIGGFTYSGIRIDLPTGHPGLSAPEKTKYWTNVLYQRYFPSKSKDAAVESSSNEPSSSGDDTNTCALPLVDVSTGDASSLSASQSQGTKREFGTELQQETLQLSNDSGLDLNSQLIDFYAKRSAIISSEASSSPSKKAAAFVAATATKALSRPSKQQKWFV